VESESVGMVMETRARMRLVNEARGERDTLATLTVRTNDGVPSTLPSGLFLPTYTSNDKSRSSMSSQPHG
jgi:hypothetical protein